MLSAKGIAYIICVPEIRIANIRRITNESPMLANKESLANPDIQIYPLSPTLILVEFPLLWVAIMAKPDPEVS